VTEVANKSLNNLGFSIHSRDTGIVMDACELEFQSDDDKLEGVKESGKSMANNSKRQLESRSSDGEQNEMRQQHYEESVSLLVAMG
jgi:hypothetical protein